MNKKLEEFNNKLKTSNIAIIGLGVSNVPLLYYLHDLGCNVTVFNTKKLDEELILKIGSGDYYAAYINNYPCEITKLSIGDDDSKFVYKFSYLFANYDDEGDLEIISDDTIQIEFTFYKTHTNVKIKTNCSDEIVGLWNSYFNKNNFEIELKKVENLNKNLLTYEGEI